MKAEDFLSDLSETPVAPPAQARSQVKASDFLSDIPDKPDYSAIAKRLQTPQVQAESGGRPDAVSPKGAVGPMQLMPSSFPNLTPEPLRDPQINKETGTNYLTEQLQKYKGDVKKALAAYNWGPGNVDKTVKKFGPDWL